MQNTYGPYYYRQVRKLTRVTYNHGHKFIALLPASLCLFSALHLLQSLQQLITREPALVLDLINTSLPKDFLHVLALELLRLSKYM